MLWNQLCLLYYNLIFYINTLLVWRIRDWFVLHECLIPTNYHFWTKMRNSYRKKIQCPHHFKIKQIPNAYRLDTIPWETFNNLFMLFGQKIKSLKWGLFHYPKLKSNVELIYSNIYIDFMLIYAYLFKKYSKVFSTFALKCKVMLH